MLAVVEVLGAHGGSIQYYAWGVPGGGETTKQLTVSGAQYALWGAGGEDGMAVVRGRSQMAGAGFSWVCLQLLNYMLPDDKNYEG